MHCNSKKTAQKNRRINTSCAKDITSIMIESDHLIKIHPFSLSNDMTRQRIQDMACGISSQVVD
jgi:hypothetical protein